MAFSVDDGTHTSGVASSGDHAQIAGLELDAVHDFTGVDVQTDRVVDLKNKQRLKQTFGIRDVYPYNDFCSQNYPHSNQARQK
jgi:hypothetical protein